MALHQRPSTTGLLGIGTKNWRQAGEAFLPHHRASRAEKWCNHKADCTLPCWVRGRVGAAETDALEEWGVRVLEAASLDEIFV